jgi:hypothetical protein
MKSKILFVIFFSYLILNHTLAQYVPNGGFENWENRIFYEEPESWNTSNTESFTEDTVSAYKVSDSYSGEYALRLTSVLLENDTLAGYSFCMGSYAGGNINDTLLFNGGFPVSGTPDSLFGYFKYGISPDDSAIVFVSFKKNGIIIGQDIFAITGNQNVYTKLKWAINPMPETPDTAVIAFACTNPDFPKPGSWLQVDSIWFGGINDSIPNTDFEVWDEIGCLEPVHWMTSNFFACLLGGDTSVTSTTDAHSGKYAMRIESIQVNMPSDSGTHSAVIGFAMPYSKLINFNEGIQSFDINFNPAWLNGYYKFKPLLNDTAVIYGYLADEEENTYPFGTLLLSSETYQPFQIPLFYPQGVRIVKAGILFSTTKYFLQGDGKSGEIGSVLYIDDINLFNPCDTFPEYHIKSFDQPFCNENSVLLDAGEGWAEYLWSTQATTQTITVPANVQAAYGVTVTSENDCKFFDTVEVIPPICDAINDILQKSMQISAYPNPTNGEFVIEFVNARPGQYVTEITNLDGKIVYKEKVNIHHANKIVKVNLSDLPAGIYMLKISEGKYNYSGRIEKN